MKKTSKISIIVLASVFLTTATIAAQYQQVKAVFEDDGEFVPGDGEQTPEQEEKQQKDYDNQDLPKYDPDTGKYNDDNNDGKDDDSDSDSSNNVVPEPYCDTPEGKAATSCHDRFDTDANGMAMCNDGTQKADPLDCKDATKKDLPICEYNVVKDCVVNEIGQTCMVGTDEDVCQDVFYGYKGSTHKTGEKTFNRDNGNNNNNNNSPQNVPDSPRTTPRIQTHHTCIDGSSISILLDCPGAGTPGAEDGLDGKCDDGFIMNVKRVCVNKIFCEQTPTASGCKFNNTPAPVSQAIPPTNNPSRTSFDLVSCKYFGAQDAMNIKQMDYTLYLKCDNYPKTGDNAYASGYADIVNARNNAVLP
jgi:hypothetical protein